MKKLLFYTFIFLTIGVFSQEQLSLETCYTLVQKNYPLAKQNDLLTQQNNLDLKVIKTKKLPQFDFLIQATYQSDVTQMPIDIPGSGFEAPNLDQYKSTLSVNQLIYGGGKIDAVANLKSAELKTHQKQIEVSLYQLKKQVNQLYFSILNLQEKNTLLNAKKNQLTTQLKEVKAGIEFGTILPNADAALEVELLKIDQQLVEIAVNKNTMIETLSKLIGNEISTTITFENPTIISNTATEINRPELDLFQLQKEQIETSENLISKQNTPQIAGFATGGFGNPGLNMLDNAFKTYYWVGVRMNWDVFNWNATKNERQSLLINKDIVDSEAEVFNLNTQIELNQQQAEISKIESFIKTDAEIIELRKKIVKTAASQLQNGVITSSAYITEFTNLFEAENNINVHNIQLLLAKANYNVTIGN
ncbi:TolC family protein [Lutibacter sp. HS1-25]|uniref:TolC family protein n=1 Tax=Lutibacter sp. HS1-25 TaxID=2485000 RepID=UPI0010129757|nr:TolC family protein [Lutibacter sp. HS1-25]RXP59438.1 TolC family protein [Lutibacter sp. HS1-25]